jgi:Antirestriction protein (ArdA)
MSNYTQQLTGQEKSDYIAERFPKTNKEIMIKDTKVVDFSSDAIDSREICDFIERLEETKRMADQNDGEPTYNDEWTAEDQSELDKLYAIVAQIEDYSGDKCADGVSLIHERYFQNYCEEYANDCGMVDEKSPLANYVDWEKWARDCAYDYTQIEIEGNTYYFR